MTDKVEIKVCGVCGICGKEIDFKNAIIQELIFGETIKLCDECIEKYGGEYSELERKMIDIVDLLVEKLFKLHERATSTKDKINYRIEIKKILDELKSEI